MFSKACNYGIKACIFIAQCSLKNERVKLGQIAHAIDSPEAYTAKILQLLSRRDLITSVKGAFGGYLIAEPRIAAIKLLHIVEAIDGEQIYAGCGLGLAQCNASKPCPIHDEFAVVRNNLKAMLQKTSLLDLALGLEDGACFLKR